MQKKKQKLKFALLKTNSMQNNGIIWAINGRGVKRQFTRQAWEHLGESKEGWTEIKEQPITNMAAKKPAKPATGEQKITNVAQSNTTTAAPTPIVEDNTNKEATSSTEVSEEQKQAFFAAAEGLNAGPIKDYFDSNNIEYKKTLKAPALVAQLGEVLSYDVVSLQKLFN